MKQDGNPGLTPKLRFPEFQDVSEWEETCLGEIAEIKLGKMLDREKHTTGRLLPYLNNISLRWNEVDTSNLPQMYFNDEELERFGLKAGDVVVCEGGEPGRAAVWDGRLPDLKFQKAIHRVRFTVPFEPRFLVLYLEAIAGTTEFERLFTGAGIRHLTRETFARLKVPLVSLSEQQLIAACLSSLDDLVAAQIQKLNALKTRKKGLMQQLFPSEGETQPRRRFPEFRNSQEWEERKAGTLFANRTEEGETGLPIYSVTMNDGLIQRSSLDRDFDDIAEPAGNKKAYAGDIAYNMMRMWQGALGVAVTDCMVSPAYVVLSPRKGICSDFFGYLLKLPKYLQLLTSNSQGLTKDRLRLYYKDFATITLPFPDISEQMKIAQFLSSLDEMIAAQDRKLDALKKHKKGLMQKLFPSPEEVEA
jgi:type I restriction enzyme, S subunit